MISDYRDDNYANINDIEYMFGDIDNYYQPILASSLFNNGYQRYHFRGHPNRSMSVTTYCDKIIPYLRVLIDENKLYEQKIQLDIGINMVHISEQKRITHFSKSDNIICLPSSDANEIINQLLTSLYEKYQHDLTISHESSSFTYEKVEELNIHFNKIDLKRGASFIETPRWLKSKKASINRKNRHDVYCFMHVITKLIVTEERRKKLVSEPNYASCTTFSDHLMAIEMRKTCVLMDKPILLGQTILDKSKELMYEFWYEYLKPKYKDKLRLWTQIALY